MVAVVPFQNVVHAVVAADKILMVEREVVVVAMGVADIDGFVADIHIAAVELTSLDLGERPSFGPHNRYYSGQ